MNHLVPRIAKILCAAALLAAACAAQAEDLKFKPYHADGIYAAGEKVGWTVTGAKSDPGTYTYTVRSNNLDVVAQGSFTLADGSATIETSFDKPAMLYVAVDRPLPSPQPTAAEIAAINGAAKASLAKNEPAIKTFFDKYPAYTLMVADAATGAMADQHIASLGAAVDPTRLAPSVPRPADFDAFWAAKLQELKKIPIDPVLTPVATTVPGVELYLVQLDSLGSHVHGYLAKPKGKGKFPALVIYQWAGVYALDPNTAASRAAEGWLVFNVDSHDKPPTETTGAPNDYYALGNTSRETSYFLNMYLRDTRAIDFIATAKSWNHKTIVLTGTSMGGQQSLVTAGLNSGRITAVGVNEPAGADIDGGLNGRKTGYPFWQSDDPRVMATGPYFDTVNFTPRITAKTLVAVGLIDTTCPPVGIWTAFNRIATPKEIIPMVESDHNHITPQKQDAWLKRSEQVLAAIVHGGQFVPNQR
jgi:cephalosporin-C deacetylase